MNCIYCKKSLKNKYTLQNHQKTAKYCLKIQGRNIIENNVKTKFKCDYCEDFFSTQNSLNRHINSKNTICLQKLNKKYKTSLIIIDKLENELNFTKNQLDKVEKEKSELLKTIASRPTTKNTINNNLNLTVFNKSQADIKRLVEEKYDTNYLLQGQKGVARFTHSHLLNIEEGKDPMYAITDKNRGNGKYKTSKGEIVSDNGMSGLTKKVYPSVKDKACRLALIEKAMENPNIYDNFQDVIKLDEDNTDFRKEMVRLTK